MVENERTEYKEKLTAALEKEAVAFRRNDLYRH